MKTLQIEQIIDCDRCGEKHKRVFEANLTVAQLERKELVSAPFFICPNIALMYRVVAYSFDFTVNIFKSNNIEEQKRFSNQLQEKWGSVDFENKLKRYIDLDMQYLGIPEEYYGLLKPIIDSYCCGLYYPAITSIGSLGERILNRLIIKTRTHFKTSVHYRKVWNKNSFDQWDNVINILKDWEIITDEVATLFVELKQYRNFSIHYNENYDFEHNCHKAIKIISQIINLQFNYIKRKDLFWVFDVPGEIWLRTEMIDNPFVKEFVLQNCVIASPYCEPFASPPTRGENIPLKPLSDEEFIELRKSRKG